MNQFFRFIFLFFVIELLLMAPNIAQDTSGDTAKHLYRPNTIKQQLKDTIPVEEPAGIPTQQEVYKTHDSINQDSLDIRLQYREDSLRARLQFVQDSLLAREVFVRDSLARRQRILDSLNLLLAQLPRLLDASQKAFSDEIIFKTSKIRIIGDSSLSNFESSMLTFDFSSPYTPWKSEINLSTKPPVIKYDQSSGRITSILAPNLSCNYVYGKRDDIMVIRTKSSILSKRTGKLYKEPLDSVFFDRQGRVVRVKKYIQFYNVVNNYQRGGKLFLHLAFVKQYEYNLAGEMTRYEITKFCDRWQPQHEKKVCNIISYSINPEGNIYRIARKNSPANEFSDGTFTYEFTSENTLAGVAFENDKKTESWKTIIEVNEDGNVSRYLYQNKGVISKTLLINYYLDDPRAKHKVETVTCIFEDDGISYYQQNNTTGKTRSRDKLTLEWTDWR